MRRQLTNQLARAIIEVLPEDQRRVLTARLGLTDEPRPPGIEDLNRELGLGFGEVPQIERWALEAIRDRADARGPGPAFDLVESIKSAVDPASPDFVEQARCLAGQTLGVPAARVLVALLFLAGRSWEQAHADVRRSLEPYRDAFRKLLRDGVIWPHQQAWTFPEAGRALPRLEATRTVRGNRIFTSRKMARDVRCESGGERLFYERLDDLHEVMIYQEQPLKVELPGKKWPYHPDAFVVLVDSRCFVAEVKPVDRMSLFSTIVKFNALAEKCEREGFGIFLGNASVVAQDLLRADPGEPVRRAILDRVSTGSMDMDEWDMLHTKLRAPVASLRSVVLQEGLRFDELPSFRVRHATVWERDEIEQFARLFAGGLQSLPPSSMLGPRGPPTFRDRRYRHGALRRGLSHEAPIRGLM